MELLQTLYREDRINVSMLNMATRLNRSLTDQLTAQLTRKESNGKNVLIFCGNAEPEELGGQICADLFESDGYAVRFAGGGVPDDEVLKLIG
jgi:methanogenic corrinoid protein MtbC1